MADSLTSTSPLSVLTVGDGDFTCSLAIRRAYDHKTIHKLIATSLLPTREDLVCVYPQSDAVVSELNADESVSILYGVDATQLHRNPQLQNCQFDLILFHYPHLGYQEHHDESSVVHADKHATLVAHYLDSARQLLSHSNPHACVHLCLCSGTAERWKLEESANRLNLEFHAVGSASRPLLSYYGTNHSGGSVGSIPSRASRKGHWLGKFGYRHQPTFPQATKFRTNVSSSLHYFLRRCNHTKVDKHDGDTNKCCQSTIQPDEETRSSNPFECSICKEKFDNEKQLTEHQLAPALPIERIAPP